MRRYGCQAGDDVQDGHHQMLPSNAQRKLVLRLKAYCVSVSHVAGNTRLGWSSGSDCRPPEVKRVSVGSHTGLIRITPHLAAHQCASARMLQLGMGLGSFPVRAAETNHIQRCWCLWGIQPTFSSLVNACDRDLHTRSLVTEPHSKLYHRMYMVDHIHLEMQQNIRTSTRHLQQSFL